METEKLQELIENEKLSKLSFDGYDFLLEFENDVWVKVNHTTEWGCSIWDIDSSIDEEIRIQKQKVWEEQKAQKAQEIKDKQDKILSNFPPEQWDEIRKAFAAHF